MTETTPVSNLKLIRKGLGLIQPTTEEEQEQIDRLIDWFSEDSLNYRINNTFMAHDVVQSTKICRIMTGASLVPCRKYVDDVIDF